MKRVLITLVQISNLSKVILIGAAMIGAMTGCTNDKPEQDGRIAVNLKTDIKPASTMKVANDQWETNDMVGLFMKRTGQTLTASGAVYSDASNVQMSISGQTLITTPQLMYPTTGSVDFVAYYPYAASMNSDFSIPVNVAGQEAGLPVEILYSNNVTNQEPSASAVTLDFTYSFAKIELTVTNGANPKLTEADFTAMTASIDGFYTRRRNFNLPTELLPT